MSTSNSLLRRKPEQNLVQSEVNLSALLGEYIPTSFTPDKVIVLKPNLPTTVLLLRCMFPNSGLVVYQPDFNPLIELQKIQQITGCDLRGLELHNACGFISREPGLKLILGTDFRLYSPAFNGSSESFDNQTLHALCYPVVNDGNSNTKILYTLADDQSTSVLSNRLIECGVAHTLDVQHNIIHNLN